MTYLFQDRVERRAWSFSISGVEFSDYISSKYFSCIISHFVKKIIRFIGQTALAQTNLLVPILEDYLTLFASSHRLMICTDKCSSTEPETALM